MTDQMATEDKTKYDKFDSDSSQHQTDLNKIHDENKEEKHSFCAIKNDIDSNQTCMDNNNAYEVKNNHKNRRQISLPIRSMTVISATTESDATINTSSSSSSSTTTTEIHKDNIVCHGTMSKSNQSLKSFYSLDVAMNNENFDNYADIGDDDDDDDDDGKRPSDICGSNSSCSNNSNIQKFKTKRFYETEEDSALMTQIFSQTIRSTSVTPTDECDMTELLLSDIRKHQQQSPTLGTVTSTGTNTIFTATAIHINNSDQKSSIPSIKTTPSPPLIATSPTLSSINYFVNDISDNYSTTEYSNAESQTDNIDMYNEPNMSSLLDNLQSDCEEFIDKSDTEDTMDPDYNPWEIKSKTTTIDVNNSISTISTIITHNHQHQINTLASTTKTSNSNSSSSINNCLRPTSIKLKDNQQQQQQHQQGSIKRRPSIVVEFYNDDLTKNLEYECEGGEIVANISSTVEKNAIDDDEEIIEKCCINVKTVDTVEIDDDEEDEENIFISTPTAAMAAAKFSYFDTTIEEEEDDDIINSENFIINNQPIIRVRDDENEEVIKEEKHWQTRQQCTRKEDTDDIENQLAYQMKLSEDPENQSSLASNVLDNESSSSTNDLHNDSKNFTILKMETQVKQQQQNSSTSVTSSKTMTTAKKSSVTTKKMSTSTRSSSIQQQSSTITSTSAATTSSTLSEQQQQQQQIELNSIKAGLENTNTADECIKEKVQMSSEKIAIKKKSGSINEQGTNKKKSKKSKKSDAEKENISVNGKETNFTTTTTTKINKEIKKVIPSNMRLHDDDLSNIDVKSLKKIYLLEQPPVNRKFKENNNKQYQIPLNRSVSVKQLRAKSVSDVRSIEIGISVKQLKSSFSKFDALQKKNILHVRSSDAGKAQEKFNDVNSETEKNCRSCGKVVYKMEEIKAEKSIWHRNCFKCNECGKQLNVDTYQSHESVLYCKPHFKLLFAPKVVEDNEPVRPKKPELIIRENQPEELPADVVRASDKPDLGLEELHQLDVKSRFQVFEHFQDHENTNAQPLEKSPSGVTRSASILSKLARFKAKGMDTGVTDEALSGIPLENSSSENEEDDDIDDNDPDAALIRSKRVHKERPMSFSNMNDIKSKFEKGHMMTREERREERKQEIQNIRSRLFMGKQAKIKEMYQQAVAESEHAIVSAGKKPEIDIGDKAKSLKEKFEKGEIFNNEDDENGETNHHHNKVQEEDMAVFEQGISKKSRSIFMELDASASKPPQLTPPQPTTPRSAEAKKNAQVSPLQMEKLKPFSTENVVKYDEKPDDIKIETSEISSKFKFFESYKPTEQKKKEFRITPPREGVVKMPSPERDQIDNGTIQNDKISQEDDPTVVAKTQTATKMLSIFRQMEKQKYHHDDDGGLKPLKQFTPPPGDANRYYENNESDDEEYSGSEEDEEEGEEEQESENENKINRYEDEYLKQARLEERAKQLRAKFEKWEANEIRREMSNGTVIVHENNESDNQIESTKSLRAKFESMREQNNISPNRPRVQVNRFV